METLTEEAPPPKIPPVVRRFSAPVLGAVVIFHLFFGGVAAIWVVSKYSAARKLTFNAGPKSPNPSERALEHRVQLQKKTQSVSAPPAVPKRVLTTGAAKVTLPPLPEIKTPESAPRTMMGAGGTGNAFGTSGATSLGGGGGGNGTAINFFGIRDVSTSIVIMIDVSDSMFTRTGDAQYPSKLVKHGKDQNFQLIRDEAIKLVESLTPQTRFGVVRWSGSAISWKPELVPATDENKKAAIEHIQNEVDYKTAKAKGRPGGTRHDYALEEAFRLKPETIYMLTDGNATASKQGGGLSPIPPQEIYKVAEEGQKLLPKKAKVHLIYYLNGKEKSDEVDMLRGLASRNSGKFQKVEAKGRSKK
ncbi:MAG: VWA domain-containing protein [Verrucomicrobiota bacterium]|nr:VWA domain-containing protein [Verrucomicrobiota bacterium]